MWAIFHIKNVRQKLGTWKFFNVFLRFPMFSNVFQCYLLSFSLSHYLNLSHSHTLSISHWITLDMLNNFCFHVYAQKSLSNSHTLSLSHSHSLSLSHSFNLCEWSNHRAGSQLKMSERQTKAGNQEIQSLNVYENLKTKVVQHVESDWMRHERMWEWLLSIDMKKSCSACREWESASFASLQVLQVPSFCLTFRHIF